MRGPAAYCAKCQIAFEVDGWPFGEVVSFDNCATACPKCGGEATIGDGTYRARNGGLEFVTGHPFTRAMAEQLEVIASRARERLKKESIRAEDVLTEIADVSPELAQKLRARGLPVFVMVLLLIWIVKSVSLNITVDVNHLIDQAYHVSRHEDPESHLDKAPPAPPPAKKIEARPPRNPPFDLQTASNWAGVPEGRLNRRARRLAAAEARKRPKQA